MHVCRREVERAHDVGAGDRSQGGDRHEEQGNEGYGPAQVGKKPGHRNLLSAVACFETSPTRAVCRRGETNVETGEVASRDFHDERVDERKPETARRVAEPDANPARAGRVRMVRHGFEAPEWPGPGS